MHPQYQRQSQQWKQEQRWREEKQRQEDETVAEADARLEKEARVRRPEKQRRCKAVEDAHVWAAVTHYVATRGRGNDNKDEATKEAVSAVAGSSTGPGTVEQEKAKGKEVAAAKVYPAVHHVSK